MIETFNGIPVTEQDKLIQFLRARDAAILSFDRRKIEAYSNEYGISTPQNDKVFWMGICKAVLALSSASEFEKKRAEKMLNDLRIHDEKWAKRFN